MTAPQFKKGDTLYVVERLTNSRWSEPRAANVTMVRDGLVYLKGHGKFDPCDMRLEDRDGSYTDALAFTSVEAARDYPELMAAWSVLRSNVLAAAYGPPEGACAADVIAATALLRLS